MFRGDITLGTKESVDVDDDSSQDTEEETESEHNGVPDTNAQRSFPSKEGFLAGITQERGLIFGMKLTNHFESLT